MPVDFDPSGMDGTEIMLTQPNDNYADEGGIKSGIQVGDVASSTFAVPAKKKKTTEKQVPARCGGILGGLVGITAGCGNVTESALARSQVLFS